MENFQDRVKKTTALIEKEIGRLTPKGKVPNLYDAIRYAMASKGKRLRPFLCVEVSRLLGCDTKKSLPFAVSCEVMHNWLLVHDDIEDGDEIRRNKPTVWKKFGVAHAINAGDLMAHEVFEIILNAQLESDQKIRLMKLVVDTITETIEGQTIEVNFRDSKRFDEREYVQVAMKKTGYYLACPLVGAAIIVDAPKALYNSFFEYGKNIGIAFQIVDDIIDLTPKKGRDAGSDIKEGKKTLMMLHALRSSTPGEKKKLLQILRKPREKTSTQDILYAKNIFEKYGSVTYAEDKSVRFVEKAKVSLSKDVPEAVRDFLEEFADFVVQR